MTLRKTWQHTALWLGIGYSLLWSAVLSELPLIQQLDLWQHDRLIRLTSPQSPPPEIALVTISQSELNTWGQSNEPQIYSTLAHRLLDAGAAVVVLNLLPNWVQTSDHPDNPIKTLIQKYSDRVVLVLPTDRATQPHASEWRSYEYFLPTKSNGDPLFPPQSILGFAEYEPEAKQPQRYRSTARQASLTGQFTLTRNLDRTQKLDSAALLTLKKFNPKKQPLPAPPTPLQIHFWGATGTFPRIEARSVLSHPSSFPNLRNKIVIVGFSDIDNPDAFAIRSPFGELMPALEVQANLLASLLTQSYYRIIPSWLQNTLIILGSILISQWVILGKFNPHSRKHYRYWLFPPVGLGTFVLISVLLLGQGWIFPLTLPLLTWTATLLSVWISLLWGIQNDLIHQQQCELDRLQTIEQTAVISQSRKLMHRLASDIHDGPLQELKLIMDRLELLQMKFPPLPIDSLLDPLETLGIHLRQHLDQTRAIAIDITPELREGLAHGLQTQLNQLIQSRELTLRVIQNLQPIEEPALNSLWLEAREDIYRFFKEAIHNVIRHAQPPYGTATQVIVSLEQHQNQCCLIVENNGEPIELAIFEPTSQQRQRGGYGTKLLDTIAAELPKGTLQRIPLAEGGLRLQLTWEQRFIRVEA